jgi:flagellar motor protein MotB
MADMTISFLFIIMILLAFFASQFSVSDTVPRAQFEAMRSKKEKMEKELQAVQAIVGTPDLSVAQSVQKMKDELERLRHQVSPDSRNPMEVYNSAVSETRKALLVGLRDQINRQIPGVNVTVSSNFDALQFQGDGLFASGKDIPTATGEARMRQIATILDKSLGCFSLGPRSSFHADCNDGYALIDALQVEGHTDNQGTDDLNMGLSANRAAQIFSLMTKQQPGLLLYQNRETQPVLSVAGFGKGRPIQTNVTENGRDANRRIDLRFIMVVPTKASDIDAIKHALEGVGK